MGAHPRSRGENESTPPCRGSVAGSSPLTRGKPGERQSPVQGNRLIPAHAGKTLPWQSRRGRIPAHPRSRGENALPVKINEVSSGSSPLTRGKLLDTERTRDALRLIPAHAGKTGGQPAISSPIRAHPRSRGENICSPCMPSALSGSSPLTRGKQELGYRCDGLIGLIPAHAGKTSRAAATSSFAAGSSPLTRGKLGGPKIEHSAHGLIPAHAGKTRHESSLSCDFPAHPRSRGENTGEWAIRTNLWGSSPLTRGKQAGRHVLTRERGLIPAHAGKTACPP